MGDIEIKEITGKETQYIRHIVMWPDQSPEFVVLPEDDFGTHFGVFASDKLVAVISLFFEGEACQFRKLATMFDAQNKGYASMLIQHTMDFARIKGARILWCNARMEKTSFYQKFGFENTGSPFEKHGQAYIRMETLL